MKLALASVLAVLLGVAGLLAPNTEEVGWPGSGQTNYLSPLLRDATVVWAVGDGADGSARSKRLARMIAADDPDRFIYLGDVYETGTEEEFAANYEAIYGRLDDRTAPTVGNHEYANRFSGYIPYWSDVHGSAPPYYAMRASGWQLLGLNSELDHAAGSAQIDWLDETLAATAGFGDCRVAFWHRPRYSAGLHADQPDIAPLWDALAGDATIVLTGHDHDMQRLEPVDGLHEFVSGAGGHEAHEVNAGDPRLAFSKDQVRGALRIRLERERAGWRFVAVSGVTLDRGSLGCERSKG